MSKSLLRQIVAVTVLTATVIGFVYYFAIHPDVRHQLASVSLLSLAIILILYIFTVLALALINSATVRLCRIELELSESLLITAYSSVVNFFGPLQSGPAFRAIYLKKKHKLNLKAYGLASLMYYFFFALFSGLFLFSGVLKWWLLWLVGLIAGILIVLHRNHSLKQRLEQLNISSWYYLAFATLLQVGLVALIYFVELRSVAPTTSFSQAIIYTGAANFALFVSLTPGAIGFRESFLLFSQRLHHIDSSTIVVASTIDRAMYIVLLLIMALFIFATHAKQRLQSKID